MSIERLILWRHGRTEWNALGRFQGQRDVALDSTGIAQAVRAAPHLAIENPTAIYCSDLSRACQTAQPLADLTGLEVTCDPRLRETSLGTWEGLDREQVEALFPDELAAWQRGDEVRRGHGETAAEVADRTTDLVREITDRHDGTVVFVAHGGSLKALMVKAIGLPEPHWMQLSALANCRWSELLRTSAGQWRLHGHNLGPLEQAPADHTPNVDSDEIPPDEPVRANGR